MGALVVNDVWGERVLSQRPMEWVTLVVLFQKRTIGSSFMGMHFLGDCQ